MFGFIIAAIAGFLVPQIETTFGKPVTAALRKVVPLEPSEHRVVAVFIAMLIAAFVAMVFDSGNAIGQSVGLLLGYFGTRIVAVIKAKSS